MGEWEVTQERKGSSDCVSSSQLPPWETVVYSLSKSGKQTVHQNQNADGGGRYSMGMWPPNPSLLGELSLWGMLIIQHFGLPPLPTENLRLRLEGPAPAEEVGKTAGLQ